MSVFLDGATEKMQARNDDDIVKLSVTVSKNDRATLNLRIRHLFRNLKRKLVKGLRIS